MSDPQAQNKDKFYRFDSVALAKTEKGNDKITLRLKNRVREDGTPSNNLAEFIEGISALASAPRGATIQLIVTEKEAEDGRKFLSASAIVRETQEFGAPRGQLRAVPKKPTVAASKVT